MDERWRSVFTKEQLEIVDQSEENTLVNLRFLFKCIMAKLFSALNNEKYDVDAKDSLKLFDIARKTLEDIWDIEGMPEEKRKGMSELFREYKERQNAT